ncbi:MAG: LysM peptidoglycan-binding domain-containing protein [Parachlamydiaceae bacterium]|nr:MAG: LysM peptidoglycan-binding domain-containing protein [Parachlamydiaceae bacterium]
MEKTANWFKPHIVSDGDFVTDANGNIQMQPTLAKLANVYHVDYKELIQLNGGKIENLSVGMSIRVKQDLLTDTPGAKKQREHIAYAILSKESWRQKQSRQNKIERCLQYLDFYDQMLALQQSNTISFDLIHQILDSSITPFTSEKKQALLIQFQLSKLMNPVQFLDLIIKEYTPTLEKLAFVMYPFLADLITLIPYSEKLLNQSSLDKKIFGPMSKLVTHHTLLNIL